MFLHAFYLMLSMLGNKFSRRHLKIHFLIYFYFLFFYLFFFFFSENSFDNSCKLVLKAKKKKKKKIHVFRVSRPYLIILVKPRIVLIFPGKKKFELCFFVVVFFFSALSFYIST